VKKKQKNKFGNSEKVLYLQIKNQKNMRKLILALFAVVLSLGLNAQTVQSIQAPFTVWGQMLVPAKTYAGTYRDTVTNASTIYLTTCKGSNGSLTAGAVYGQGVMNISLSCTKITGAPFGSAKLEQSYDGSNWYMASPTYNNQMDSLIIDSVSATKTKTWTIADNCAPYYRVKLTLTGTQSSSYISQYFLNRKTYGVSNPTTR
jgi:hypothetical protein